MRIKFQRTPLVLATAALLAFSAAACGGDDDEADAGTATTEAGTDTTAPADTGGSATTALHVPDPFRASGCVAVDQSLKSPAIETDFAVACASMNRTPSGVTTGPRVIVVAHDRLTAVDPTSNAARISRRMTRADYETRCIRATHRTPSAGVRTSSTALRDPKPSSLCSAANGSPIHCSPSITNWYS